MREFEHAARQTSLLEVAYAEQRMESHFQRHLGILHSASEATQAHEKNALLNEAYVALQEQKSKIEAEAGEHLKHEASAQHMQLRNAHLYCFAMKLLFSKTVLALQKPTCMNDL